MMKRPVFAKNKALSFIIIGVLTVSLLTGCGTETKADEEQTEGAVNQVLAEVKELANAGKMIGSENFTVRSKREEIEKAWGKAPEKDPNYGFDLYKDKHIFIVYTESNQVDQFITTSPKVTTITREEVIKAFGQPMDTKADEGIENLFYETEGSTSYDLFVQIQNNKVTEISVGQKPTPDSDQVNSNE